MSANFPTGYGPQPFVTMFARGGAILRRGFDWTGWLSQLWQPNIAVATGYTVRSRYPTGYEYAVIVPGQTGSQEPSWPASPGAAIRDGSATWVCQAMSSASLISQLESAIWMAPAGISVSDNQQSGNVCTTLINLADAIINTDYQVTCAATMADSEVPIGTINILVR